jgi:hypothetical protein
MTKWLMAAIAAGLFANAAMQATRAAHADDETVPPDNGRNVPKPELAPARLALENPMRGWALHQRKGPHSEPLHTG